MTLTELFESAVTQKASDIHLALGEPPFFRVAGLLLRQEFPVLDRANFEKLFDGILTVESWARLNAGIPVERPVVQGDLNFALIAFRAGEGLCATFRILPTEVPDIERIGEGAAELMQQFADTPRGLVLIAGPTASGKNTTASSIVDLINRTKAARIFVVEKGPNYRQRSKLGLITQIQVGLDFDSYERALEAVHNADLDVVTVDDIPTAEALRQIVILAETGHLVIANMHADSVTDVLRRLFHAAGSDAVALHRSLAQVLSYITVQRLFPRIDRTGRVPAYEWLAATAEVKQAILHGDLGRVVDLQASEAESQTLKAALDHLVAAGKITEEQAAPHRV